MINKICRIKEKKGLSFLQNIHKSHLMSVKSKNNGVMVFVEVKIYEGSNHVNVSVELRLHNLCVSVKHEVGS